MKVVDVAPLHDKFGLPDVRIVTPGRPEESTLFLRVARRGRGQMPQLSTNVVDQPAVDLLREWIRQIPKPKKKATD